jgi:Ca2+-transporting ATPase
MTETVQEQPWHALRTERVAEVLATDIQDGLSEEEAQRRLTAHGPNRLVEQAGSSPIKILLSQFSGFIIWILIGAALVSGIIGEWLDASAILVIVVVNAILGFVQEYRAEQSLAALRKLSNPMSRVVRSGEAQVVPSDDIVPGDLLEIESGDNMPADARIVSCTANLASQEAALTGESLPVRKSTAPVDSEDVPLGDRSSMVYMGTSVSTGKGRAVVVATGMQAELGKIAGLIQEIPHEMTPLQHKLQRFGKWIVYLSVALVCIIFAVGAIRGYPWLSLFMISVSLAVAAIPEGLPAVVTIALALGVQRMVRRNALIRKLPSVETLGCATVICSDKTGTLTRNEMTVQRVWAGGRLIEVTGVGYSPEGTFQCEGQQVDPAADPDLRAMLEAGCLCNGAQLDPPEDGEGWTIVGDPTEGALLTAAAKAGIMLEQLESECPLVEELPFDSERKRMTMVRRKGDQHIAFVKGAPDVLLELCSHIQEKGVAQPLTDNLRDAIVKANEQLASEAMRVLATAYRELPASDCPSSAEEVERDLTFLGLVAMIDPPRTEVKEAILRCRNAGIRPIMITGDHLGTAVAVAREIGSYDASAKSVTGLELERMSDEMLDAEVEKIAVYARVSAEHKLRIVRAWKRKNQIVAMTGDGVNDAPALKEADIGVAMGITGTDVTKEVSDMVVTDDNFTSIVNAVEEGRAIYDNIKKFVNYMLSCNFSEVLVLFVAMLIGLRDSLGELVAPLVPIQILWMNIVTDGLPALALGVDPPEPNIMERPPRSPGEQILSKNMGLSIVTIGTLVCAATVIIFALGLHENAAKAQTMAFTSLVALEIVRIQMVRRQYNIGVFSNPHLLAAVASSIGLQLLVVYLPVLQPIFKTVPLGLKDWGVIALACVVVYVIGVQASRIIARIVHQRD